MSDTIADEPENLNWQAMEVDIEKIFKKTPNFSSLSGEFLINVNILMFIISFC